MQLKSSKLHRSLHLIFLAHRSLFALRKRMTSAEPQFSLLPESTSSATGNRASQSIPLSSQTMRNSLEYKGSCDRNRTKAAVTCDSDEVNRALQVRDKLNFPPWPGPLRAPREKAELNRQLMIFSPSS